MGRPSFAPNVVRERVCEERDVVSSFPQRRQIDREHREAVVQIRAKALLHHRFTEVAVRRGDDADFDFDGRRPADPLELFFLHHTEKLRL